MIASVKSHPEVFATEADIESNTKILLEALEKMAKSTGDVSQIGSKLPTFLGIQITNSTNDLLQVILDGCVEIEKSATIDAKDDLKDLENYIKTGKGSWKSPNSQHITVLFIGGNTELAETSIFKEFKADVKHEIKLEAIVIIPHKLAFGIAFPKTEISNKVPHITLLVNHCPPKLSNSFGEALFLYNEELKEKYASGFFQKEGESYIGKHNVKVEGKVATAYLYKPKKAITMNGISKFF